MTTFLVIRYMAIIKMFMHMCAEMNGAYMEEDKGGWRDRE